MNNYHDKYSPKDIKINGRDIGVNYPCFIIAEVAQAHEGSLGLAHSFIDAAADSGADAIKFQTHLSKYESTFDEEFRYKFSSQDKTRFEYWQRMEFNEDQWRELFEHANSRNIVFLSSPFCEEAVNLLYKIGVRDWKIGSGEFLSDSIINFIASKKGTILLSTGMSTWAEIQKITAKVNDLSLSAVLMQCNSKYPTPLEKVGLNIIDEMRNRFNLNVGFSDHSGKVSSSIAAISKGISVLEVHVTFDKKMFGPDTSSSITFKQLKELVKFRNEFEIMIKNPVNKDKEAKSLKDMRIMFNKSIALKYPLKKGVLLKKEDLTYKKPGGGISPDKINEVIGMKLKNDMPATKLLKWSHLKES
tara:strand:+ start:235 stop:1311 length:1077 start_codon:yes stop_codon:yes gene_type:complete